MNLQKDTICTVPVGTGGLTKLLLLLAHGRKIVLVVSRFAWPQYAEVLTDAGIPYWKFYGLDRRDNLKEFNESGTGILFTTMGTISGWRAEDGDLMVFLDMGVISISGKRYQELRARCAAPAVFINCLFRK